MCVATSRSPRWTISAALRTNFDGVSHRDRVHTIPHTAKADVAVRGHNTQFHRARIVGRHARKRTQCRGFLGIAVDRTGAGRAVDAHVGDRIDPGIDLVVQASPLTFSTTTSSAATPLSASPAVRSLARA